MLQQQNLTISCISDSSVDTGVGAVMVVLVSMSVMVEVSMTAVVEAVVVSMTSVV